MSNNDGRRDGKERRVEDRREGSGVPRTGEDRRKGGEPRSGENRRKSSSDRRRETRIKKRIVCEVVEGDKRTRGFVLDVSPNGLFVQTPKPIQPGAVVGIEFTSPELGQKIQLRARVARSLRVPHRLASVTSPGVGVRIEMAPPEYYDMIVSLTYRDEAATAPPASEEPAEPAKRKLPPRMPKPEPEPETLYRVQAQQTGGPRSRSLIVNATSREQAESLALEELGSDWKIIGAKGA